ncbi:DUF4249 domain-containing protein [Hymenobacter fodinae]|nr:DUF4249 domain-containing protein [Hymenobacter fodinae]
MNLSFLTGIALLLGLYLLSGCVDSFEPKVAAKDANILVVDGSINSEGRTTIKLTRTTGLAPNASVLVERKARVYIEEQGGRQYPLTESQPGVYQSMALMLPREQLFRLHFTLASDQEYTSEYTPAQHTPAIDSVSWKTNEQGVQIYVNAHDGAQQTRHYRWSYDETWEIKSRYVSYLEYKNKELIFRKEDINHCWGSEFPTTITLANTLRLSRNVISEQPLILVPVSSSKLAIKYSILVRQYALSAGEYSYWEALRKNTENIGTLFDPLPTQLTGNVHNVADASEPVIGFVGAQSVSEKRIFIRREQLPNNWRVRTGYEGCVVDTAKSADFFASGEATPIGADKSGIYYSSTDCVDCRKRGTTVRPSFWQ